MTKAPDPVTADLVSVAERWVALDGGAWNVERHAREKAELLTDTVAAIAKAYDRALNTRTLSAMQDSLGSAGVNT